MKVGDLVRACQVIHSHQGNTGVGIIVKTMTHHDGCSNSVYPIAWVLWETGKQSWIEFNDIKIVNVSR